MVHSELIILIEGIIEMSDLISRKALIEKAYEEAKGMAEPYEDFGTLVDWLASKMPSMQPDVPDRKVGRWIPVDSGTVNGRCSECGFESHLYEDDVYGYDYCPDCGARLL